MTAKQTLAATVLRAPTRGTVVALGLTPGDAVAAGTDVVTMLSGGVTTVAIAATTDQVQQLTTGLAAEVTPIGASEALPATVTAISTVPSTSETGDVSFPVTVELTDRGLDLPQGASAAVAVTLAEVTDVLTVPTSAVANGVVRVVDGDVLVRTRVTTGLVGTTRVEVSDGLAAGDVVVLADLSQAVPSGDTDTTTGPGGFGGGQGGPGVGGGTPRDGGGGRRAG